MCQTFGSGDSKWVAYGTRTLQSGSTKVYFWDGSAFKELALPANLPEPKIKPRKGDTGVKLKGYAVEPLKWINPGEVELSSKLMGEGRDIGFHYTGSIVITVTFDLVVGDPDKYKAWYYHLGLYGFTLLFIGILLQCVYLFETGCN